MSIPRSRKPAATPRALSGDAQWLAVLREGDVRGRVHSVFDRVVNVRGDRGELFSIATRDVDNAPNTVVIDVPAFDATALREGDHVTGSARSLELAEHAVIALDTAIPWHPQRTPYPRASARLERNLVLARAHAAQAFGRDTRAASPGVAARLDLLRACLGVALSNGERETTRVHGKAMLGLGPGLTPSGDDFVLGLFAVLHVDESPCAQWRDLCTDIVGDIDDRTNAISAAALKMAAQGRVRESIDTLLTMLMTGDRETVRRALDRVLAIGSTSGADIVAGIVAGFDANLHATESRSVRVDG